MLSFYVFSISVISFFFEQVDDTMIFNRAKHIYFFTLNFLGTQFYLGARLDTRKNERSKPKCTSDRETTKNIVCFFYYFNRTCIFHI